MEDNVLAIETEMGTLSFYMQGGIGYSECYLLSASQRRLLSKVIEKHYKAVSGNPDNLIG